MAYQQGGDIASLRFLFANVVYQTTNALLASTEEKDSDVWDDAVLIGDAVSSYLTEGDAEFAKEWAQVQKDRSDPRKAAWAPGENRAQDAGFRQREFKAMVRAMCRANQLIRHASEAVEWKVNGQEVKP